MYLGGVSRDVTEREVYKAFDKFGKILEVTLKNKYGFIYFEEAASARNAILKMHGKNIFGEGKVTVEKCQPVTGASLKGRSERELCMREGRCFKCRRSGHIE